MKIGLGKNVAGQCSMSVVLGLPWCCILPAALSVGGLAAGIGAVQLWSLKLIPLFFALSLFFILRAHWLIYFKKQGKPASVVITWISTIIAGVFWNIRFGIIPINYFVF